MIEIPIYFHKYAVLPQCHSFVLQSIHPWIRHALCFQTVEWREKFFTNWKDHNCFAPLLIMHAHRVNREAALPLCPYCSCHISENTTSSCNRQGAITCGSSVNLIDQWCPSSSPRRPDEKCQVTLWVRFGMWIGPPRAWCSLMAAAHPGPSPASRGLQIW